jgi:hypothetical protein
MKQTLKEELKSAFQAPSPTGKELFLKQLCYPKITYQEFLLNQLFYIRKRIWIASVLILLLGWMTIFQLPVFQYWTTNGFKIYSISSLLPILSLMTITEVYRSFSYKMVELEESCRFSLLQIVMARLNILGAGNGVILILLLIFINQVSAYSLLQTFLYVIMPYLFACATCLWLLNRTRGLDGIYSCAFATFFFSIASILCERLFTVLYTDLYLNVWLALFAGCLVMIVFQIHKLVKQLEEKQWNLYLTE